jgi:hypothetical protein
LPTLRIGMTGTLMAATGPGIRKQVGLVLEQLALVLEWRIECVQGIKEAWVFTYHIASRCIMNADPFFRHNAKMQKYTNEYCQWW